MDIDKKIKEKLEERERLAGQFNQLTKQIQALNGQREQVAKEVLRVDGAVAALQEVKKEKDDKQPILKEDKKCK